MKNKEKDIKNKKKIIEELSILCFKLSGKKVKSDDNLFDILDSLDLMTFISAIDKKFQKKLKKSQLLNKDKLSILFIAKQLN